jgi:hypothetical protein
MAVTLWYDVMDHDGDVLGTFPLEEPTLIYKLSDSGVCNLSVALSHPDLTQDLFAPRRTDYIVKLSTDNGSTFSELQGGICAPVGLKTRDDRVRFGGVDWLAWLEQPYHFEGYAVDPEDWTATDVIKYWVEASQEEIIEDVLAAMYDGTTETLELTGVYLGTGWLEEVSQFLQIGDTQNVIDFIRSVGGLVEPYGFDFTCDYDKKIFFYAPRRVTAESAMPIALFTPSGENGLLEIDWQNNGPLATASASMPTAALMKYYSYTPSRVMFRKWLEIIPLNEYYRSAFQVQQATNDIGGLHSNPQKDNTITVLPHYMDPFDETVGFYNHCGQVVYVDSEDAFMPYHVVDAPYIVTQQEITHSGDWVMKLTLDQIY